VEADRGKDLGKVIVANIQHPSQIPVHIKLSNGILGGLDGETAMKTGNFEAKCIYRLAQPVEVNMLLDKARDESKALAICQAKVRQKALPMEVVDAEYQWYVQRKMYNSNCVVLKYELSNVIVD
jgi:cell fate regulator YaaT (PSP1 superfamily)